jgi:hypothetical protein
MWLGPSGPGAVKFAVKRRVLAVLRVLETRHFCAIRLLQTCKDACRPPVLLARVTMIIPNSEANGAANCRVRWNFVEKNNGCQPRK